MGDHRELVDCLIQNLHSHSLRHLARSDVSAWNSLVVLVTAVGGAVAGHGAGGRLGDVWRAGIPPLHLWLGASRTTYTIKGKSLLIARGKESEQEATLVVNKSYPKWSSPSLVLFVGWGDTLEHSCRTDTWHWLTNGLLSKDTNSITSSPRAGSCHATTYSCQLF